MKKEETTPLVKKILEEIIEPAISLTYPDRNGIRQDLDFVVLLKKIKKFYERQEGENKDFSRVKKEAGYY